MFAALRNRTTDQEHPSNAIDILNIDINSDLTSEEFELFQFIKSISKRPDNYVYSQTLEDIIETALNSLTRLHLLHMIKTVYSELHSIDLIRNRIAHPHANELFTRASSLYPTFPDLKFSQACALLTLSHHGDKKNKRAEAFTLMHSALVDKISLNASDKKIQLRSINTCKIYFEKRLLQSAKQSDIKRLVENMLLQIWHEAKATILPKTATQEWQSSHHILSNNTAIWYNPEVAIQDHNQQKLFDLLDTAYHIMSTYLEIDNTLAQQLSTLIEQFSTAEVMALGFEIHPWSIIYGHNVSSIKNLLPKEDKNGNIKISKENIRDICQHKFLRAFKVIEAQNKIDPDKPFEQHITAMFFSSLKEPLQHEAFETWINFHFGPIAYYPPPTNATREYYQQRKFAIEALEGYYLTRFESAMAKTSDAHSLTSSQHHSIQLLKIHRRYLLLLKAVIIRDHEAMATLKNIFIEYISWKQSSDQDITTLSNWQRYGFVLPSPEKESRFTEMVVSLIPYFLCDSESFIENSQHIMAYLFSYGSRIDFGDVALSNFAQQCMSLADAKCNSLREEYLQCRHASTDKPTALSYFDQHYNTIKGIDSRATSPSSPATSLAQSPGAPNDPLLAHAGISEIRKPLTNSISQMSMLSPDDQTTSSTVRRHASVDTPSRPYFNETKKGQHAFSAASSRDKATAVNDDAKQQAPT